LSRLVAKMGEKEEQEKIKELIAEKKLEAEEKKAKSKPKKQSVKNLVENENKPRKKKANG